MEYVGCLVKFFKNSRDFFFFFGFAEYMEFVKGVCISLC